MQQAGPGGTTVIPALWEAEAGFQIVARLGNL